VLKEEIQSGWLYGWKDIVAYMGVVDKATLIRWEHRFGCPILRGPYGRPMAHRAMLTEWLMLFAEMTGQQKKALAKKRRLARAAEDLA